jgi:hypothetical protein
LIFTDSHSTSLSAHIHHDHLASTTLPISCLAQVYV